MDDETLKIHFERLAEDASLDITARQLNKFYNLAKELRNESDISLEELIDEFRSIAPSDSDEWEEFIEAISEFLLENIDDNYTDDIED